MRFNDMHKIASAICLSIVAMTGFEAAAETDTLPLYTFEIGCDFPVDEGGKPIPLEHNENYQKLANSLVDFVSFAKKYQGRAVYVRFLIESSNSAGGCDMFRDHLIKQLPQGVKYDDLDIAYGIRRLPEEASDAPRLSIWARTLGTNAGSTSVILPDISSVPINGLFITREFGHFYVFQGPVVMNYLSGNGFDAAQFYPLQNSEIFWKEISKIEPYISKY